MLSKSSLIAHLLARLWLVSLLYSIIATSMNLPIISNHFKIHNKMKMATMSAIEQYCSRLPNSTL